MVFFEKMNTRKRVREALRHARHVRNIREDVMPEADLRELTSLENDLREAAATGEGEATGQAYDRLCACMRRLLPPRPNHWFCENLEILVVALAVAMGFRTYFLQPFKIPTGSMERTLYGIHTDPAESPALTDRMPLKAVKWFLTGRWYKEVRINIPGVVGFPRLAGSNDPSSVLYDVGPRTYKLPKAATPNFRPGDYVSAGEIFWSGHVITGDHVFVDKIRWNFTRPKRGQVVVFGTDSIPGITSGTHYIKRLIGLPGEAISIDPPNVLINGQPITAPETIARIARRDPKYAYGYQLARAMPNDEAILTSPDSSLGLGPDEYFALGDNTGNSKDGRFWGAVPQAEMVGPAFMIYWPLSARWGLSR